MSLKSYQLAELPDAWRAAWFGPAGPQPDHEGQIFTTYDNFAVPAYLIVERTVGIDPQTTDSGGAALLPQNFVLTGGGYFVSQGGRNFSVTTDAPGGPDEAPYSAWLVNVQLQSGGEDFVFTIRAIGLFQAPPPPAS